MAGGKRSLRNCATPQRRLAERAAVLDELVSRQEGLSAGVKEVLRRAADPSDTVFRGVRGLVADVFQVSVETAPLVEIALGQKAQHVVATSSAELFDHLQSRSNRLGGRVGFVWLEGKKVASGQWPVASEEQISKSPSPQITKSPKPDLEGQPGVIGRADRFVESQPCFAPLAEQLLGRTWFVENLAQAISLAESVGRGLSYVTLAGELLEADGTLVVGPRSASTGLISQRSQLRVLRAQAQRVDGGHRCCRR